MKKLIVFGVLAACGGHNNGSGGADADTSFSMIRIQPPQAMLTVPVGGTATQSYMVIATTPSGDVDVTATCALTVDPNFGAIAQDGTLTALAHGGKTLVTASCGATATSELDVLLAGAVVLGPNTPANAQQIFGGATLTVDPAHSPTIQYPIDKAVAPLNLPPMELQWTTTGDDLFHVALASTFAAVDIYTSDPQATLALADWDAILGTAVGESLQITVEGLVQAAPTMKYASPSITLGLSHDTIDTSAIYYWASSQGSIMSTNFGQTTPPTVVKANCTACHSLSRAGSRIGYSRCVANNCGNEFVGFMHFNPVTAMWDEVVDADNLLIRGTYTTFAPVGNPFPDDTTGLAMVTSSSGTLALYDPDTGAGVASNLAAVATAGKSALMPDWSADGNTVVFAQSDAGQSVDVSNSSIATMSYDHSSGSHVFGTPKPLVTAPITLNAQSYTNLFFPSFSPDGTLVVFDAARTAWRNLSDEKTAGQRLVIVSAAGGTPIDLTALNNGTGDHDITWPHWAPGATSDYYWVVFASEQDYGHEITAAHTDASCVQNGVQQCKQIWIGAISKAALMSGNIDPSAPGVWLPGQDLKADNISPYWTVPAQIQ